MVYVVAEKRERVFMRLGDDRHLGYGDPDVLIDRRVGPLTIRHLTGESDIEREYVREPTVRKAHRAVKLLSRRLTENASLARRSVNDVRDVAKLPHRNPSNLSRVHEARRLTNRAWYPATRQHRHRRTEPVTR